MDSYTLESSQTSLHAACSLARKWLPPIEPQDKVTVMDVLTGTESTIGAPLLRKYIELLRPYTQVLGIEDNKPHEADCVASGIIFFYSCLFYIMHFPDWGTHIEDIFLYSLLYILVDHYIDDIRIKPEFKDKSIAQMSILILDPLAYKTIPLIDPVLTTIACVYYRLITRCPDTKGAIITLFRAEIEGLSIQKTESLPREQYYDIALRKGGYTVQVLQKIVGNSDPSLDEAAYHMGEIIQELDDMLDVLADQRNGIHTITTHDLKIKGHLDDIWIDVMMKIEAIDPRFTIFKVLYTFFAVYIPARYPSHFSEELSALASSLNLFDCNVASMLVETIMSELTAIQILESL